MSTAGAQNQSCFLVTAPKKYREGEKKPEATPNHEARRRFVNVHKNNKQQ
jgi:hypothetical protein